MNTFHPNGKIRQNMGRCRCLNPAPACADFEPSIIELPGSEQEIEAETIIEIARTRGIASGILHAEAMLREPNKIPTQLEKRTLIFLEVWQTPGHKPDKFFIGLKYLDLHMGDGFRWRLANIYFSRGFDRKRCCLIGLNGHTEEHRGTVPLNP